MARPYSDKFLLGLNHADSKRIGVKLAKVCVKQGFPVIHVATAFGVSRMAIHSWFRGKPVRDKNNTKIEKFIELIEKEMVKGSLDSCTRKDLITFLLSDIKPQLDTL